MSGVERILGHEPLKKIYVALKTPRSLVQAGGFRAVLYSRDILARPASTPATIRLKPNTAILTIALLSIPIFLPIPLVSARGARTRCQINWATH